MALVGQRHMTIAMVSGSTMALEVLLFQLGVVFLALAEVATVGRQVGAIVDEILWVSRSMDRMPGCQESRGGKLLQLLEVITRVNTAAPVVFETELIIDIDEKKPGDQGIISAAIANATALLRKPLQKGQENVSLLDQQPNASPKNSQFTFTCESDGAKGMTFPEQSLYAAGYPQRPANAPLPQSSTSQKFSNQGTQTTPDASTQGIQPNLNAPQPATSQQVDAPGKKPRRRRGDVHALAARQRRLQQEYANLHHPPAPEDIWICEFCEYESIFGAPPMALIRQYEIKDRKERRRLAEKRRLLEKAKMKGRKGRKQSKNAAKNAAHNTQQATHQQHYDQTAVDQGLTGQGEEYFDDGYDDDPVAMPGPPSQASAKKANAETTHLANNTSTGRTVGGAG